MVDLYARAQSLGQELTACRRELHAHPELAMEEHYTAQWIEAQLNRWQIPHRRVGATGVLGILRGTRPGGHTVGLRADIDALPIQELNQVSYRSQTDGVMHACGHDAHTACLLGAARLLAEQLEHFGGEIRLIFQPGEEVGLGAFDFIEAGALEGVERVFGLHTAHEIPAGTVSLTPGLNNAAVDQFRILIHGKAAHVSTPQLGADAIYIASHLVVALQALEARCTSPVEPVILGVGKLNAGTTYNALAEEAVLEGTTRTITQATRDWAREKIDQAAAQTAALYGGTAEVVWTGICSALYNDDQVCREAAAAAQAAIPGVRIIRDRPFSLGGDNFAEFNRAVPGAYAYLGTGNPELPGTLNPAHNGYFDIDESTLPIGAALYAAYALWWLSQGEVDG